MAILPRPVIATRERCRTPAGIIAGRIYVWRLAWLLLIICFAFPLAQSRAGDGEDSLGAAAYGEIAQVLALLERGVDIDHRGQRGETALIIASYAGHELVVEALLARDASVNVVSEGGWTALILASNEGHEGIVKALLAAGARQVVAASWATKDRWTSQQMKIFYSHLRRRGAAEALARAHRHGIKRLVPPNPRFWAPYALYGGW